MATRRELASSYLRDRTSTLPEEDRPTQFGSVEERRMFVRDRFGSVSRDEDGGGDRNRFANAFMGGVRNLASALEPFQMPADYFQAAIAGAIDPDTTITERFSRLDPVAYIPWGRAPTRATSGYEIMEMVGIEDENARRWGGVVFDFTADPLLAGAFLKIGGTLSRSQSLVRLGSRVDRALSPAGVNSALDNLPAKQWVNNRANDVMDAFVNMPVFWAKGGKESGEFLTYGDYFMSRTSALGRQFKSTAVRNADGDWVRIDPKTGAEVENFGKALFKGQALSRQRARNVSDRARDLVLEAQQGVLGEDAVPWFRRASDIITRGRTRAERAVRNMPADLRDAIFSTGYDVADNVGFLASTPKSATTAANVPEVVDAFAGFGRRTKAQQELIEAARNKIIDAAENAGFDPRDAVQRFEQFTGRIIEADAMLGFHLSGYDHVKTLFMRRMAEMGLAQEQAYGAWVDMIQAGMGGKEFMKWKRIGGVNIAERFADSGVKNLDGVPLATVGDLLEAETTFRGLNIQDYLRNLQQGHMRRAYALFQDPKSFTNYMDNIRHGRVLPSNIIDDTHVERAFGDDAAVREAYENYMKNMEGTVVPYTDDAGNLVTPRSQRGVVVRQSSLIEGIRDQLVRRGGVPIGEANARAQQGIHRLIKELQGGDSLQANSPLGQLLDEVMEIAAKYQQHPGQSIRGGFGRAMFSERESLTRKTLEKLGELALPQVSLMETARAARSQVGWTEFINSTYQEASRRGYVTMGPVTREGQRFVPVQGGGAGTAFMGPFAGAHVHPYLLKELKRAARDRAGSANNFSRVRSLITGGYLASPNVITANLFGGVYTSSLMGIAPTDMFHQLGSTLKDFRASSRDVRHTFMALDDLKRQISVDDTTLINADIEDLFRSAGVTRELTPNSIQGAFDQFAGWFQQQLDSPLGQKWAGLDGFQFVENWMKVSAFKARRNVLARRAGISLDEFSKPFADRAPNVQALDVAAAEAARVAVFDYSDIPESVRLLRDSGLLLFPAFPYFLTARTMRAALERPGVVAAADRMSDTINNAQMDPDTKRAVWASMPEWLRDEQGVVVPFRSWEDENGNTRRSVIPFNQLVPTATFLGNPWAESLFSGGIYKPFVEMGAATFITQDGEAPFSARYGQRVFEQGIPRHEQAAQAMGYLANNLAPGVVRKIASYTPGEGWGGLLGSMSVEMEGPLADSVYSLWEIENQRAERKFWDNAVASVLRSPQVVTIGGPIANIRKNLTSMQFQMGEEVRALEQRRDRAMMRGQQVLATQIQEQIMEIKRDYQNRMQPLLQAVADAPGEE